MSYFASTYLRDESGVAYGVKHVQNKPRVSSMSYLYDIAEGNVSGHTAWTKIGYNPALVADTEAELWSATGAYVFPSAEQGLEVVSSSTNDDGSPVIKGDATGNTVQADAGGSATSLVDADVDFEAATAVAVGDCVILDPHGTTPEWGYVTTVATHTLTVQVVFHRAAQQPVAIMPWWTSPYRLALKRCASNILTMPMQKKRKSAC